MPGYTLVGLTARSNRICVGMHFANQALFIGFATILWAMDLRKARDALGHEITPDPNALVDAGVVVCACFCFSSAKRS